MVDRSPCPCWSRADAPELHSGKRKTTGLSEPHADDNIIGGKGYIGTGITTPYRKPAGGELFEWQKEFSTSINKIHYVIGLVIAHFKTWRCMHTCYHGPERA